MTDTNRSRVTHLADVTRLSPPITQPAAENAEAHEDQRLRRAEAGERRTVANVTDPLISRQVAAPGLGQAAQKGILGKPAIRAANDDRPATRSFRARVTREAMPAGRYEEIAPDRSKPAARVIQPDGKSADMKSDEVGQTIMAMPQIISSRYATGNGGAEAAKLAARHAAELNEARRPALPLVVLGLFAAAAIFGVMYWGGGIDPLITNIGGERQMTIVASLSGGPVVSSPSPPLLRPTIVPASAAIGTAIDAMPAAAMSSELSSSNETKLIERGNHLLEEGDFAGARSVFEVLSQKGSADGAYGYARTFDPAAFLNRQVEGIQPDKPKAVEWYRRAADAGSIEAKARLMAMETE